MQFPKFQTPTSFVKQYLEENPEVLETYVKLGVLAVNVVTVPLGGLLKHLLEVQNLDPNTMPGARQRALFQQALDETFTKKHTKEYDSDFDFSWLDKKFKEVRQGWTNTNMSREEFYDLTDVSRINPTIVNDIPKVEEVSVSQPNVSVTIDKSPIQELADLFGEAPVNQVATETDEKPASSGFIKYGEPGNEREFDDENFMKMYSDVHSNPPRLNLPKDRDILCDLKKAVPDVGPLSVQGLKRALERIVEVTKEFEENSKDVDLKTLFARTDFLKKVKQNVEQRTKPVRPLKKTGKIHRTKTGKVDAVKTSKKSVNKSIDRVKLVRAYDLAQEMCRRGLCEDSKVAIEAQTEEIMTFTDDTFDSLTRVVERHPVIKYIKSRDEDFKKTFNLNKSGSFTRSPRR